MPAKDPLLYLIHIRECCERILDYTGGIETTWPSVPVVQDAVCRNLEIIGEAARRFDDAYRLAHAEFPFLHRAGPGLARLRKRSSWPNIQSGSSHIMKWRAVSVI